MSGHSKWSTIKRQKEVNDQAKGKVFTKLGQAISIAVKTGGGADPDANAKLRVAVDAARAANMPKDNIERAINKAKGGDVLDEVTYEGFGHGGVGIIIEAATDNRNRTSQEIKNILEKGGGNLGGPGSVLFGFEPKGLIVVKRQKSVSGDDQMLALIDSGAEDVEETDDAFEVYTCVEMLSTIREQLAAIGQTIESVELIKRPTTKIPVTDSHEAERLMHLLTTLEDHNDVQKVFTNGEF
jgi:YebC/PmpR family DNA-binding regulatory protein